MRMEMEAGGQRVGGGILSVEQVKRDLRFEILTAKCCYILLEEQPSSIGTLKFLCPLKVYHVGHS